MLPHFNSLGFPCPTTTNPADFALDLITVDLQDSSRETATRSRVEGLIASWSNGDFAIANNPTTISTPAELGALVRKTSSFFSAYPILVHRASINFRRQPPLIVARIMQVTGLVCCQNQTLYACDANINTPGHYFGTLLCAPQA